MEILLFWRPGRVAGPEAGPGRKWQGLGPALSIASAATATTSMLALSPLNAGRDQTVSISTLPKRSSCGVFQLSPRRRHQLPIGSLVIDALSVDPVTSVPWGTPEL